MITTPTDPRSARDALSQDGLVRLPAILPPDAVRAIRAHLLSRIADFRFVEVSGALRPAPGTELDIWEIGREPALAALPAAVAAAVDRAFGAGVWTQAEGEAGGLFMPNLPCPRAPWEMSRVGWHVDEATPVGGGPSGVLLAFALLDVLEPEGGATVAIAGSPRRLAALADRLGAEVNTEVALAALAEEEPWFAALLRDEGGWREPRLSQGVPLRVEALAGDAGDVVLMDPRCLHTPSANVSPRPRLVMRMTLLRIDPGRPRALQSPAGGTR